MLKERKTGVLDFETDPFQIGRVPAPFAVCVYFDKNDYFLQWGDYVDPENPASIRKFLKKLMRALNQLPECILYAHNGGKFDFHFLIPYAEPQTLKIRNGRVVEMKIGKCTLKDSWPLMPFPLDEYRKTPIDYSLFEYPRRNKQSTREKIESYLLDDCIYLLELVTGFRAIVGERDTIGAASFLQMREMGIKIRSMNESHDAMFRPYYFGGRVEAFERGIHEGKILYLDINSAYPNAMRFRHPHGAEYMHRRRLPRRELLGPCFVRLDATSSGALPLRKDNGDIEFPNTRSEFHATGWEILAGLDTKTLRVHEVLDVWEPRSFICFRDYVETFYAKRLHSKKTDDAVGALAYKYLLNSGYGKFGQNPREFRDYCLAPYGKAVRGYDWETDFGAVSLWSKPSYKGWGFYDVATAASITGFERAYLWRGIKKSKGAIYCDTDAVLCTSSFVSQGDSLGDWKLEGIAKRAAIAGKKLYGLEWETPQKGQRYKVSSKGARLTFSDIISLCKGKSVKWENAAPTFTLGNPHFIRREIRAT